MIFACAAALAMLATTAAHAAPLLPGTYVVRCGADGKGYAYDLQGNVAGVISGWPCPIPDRKIVVTARVYSPPSPSYTPSAPALWAGYMPMQIVELLKGATLVNNPAAHIDPNQFEPLETMPTLWCNEAHFD